MKAVPVIIQDMHAELNEIVTGTVKPAVEEPKVEKIKVKKIEIGNTEGLFAELPSDFWFVAETGYHGTAEEIWQDAQDTLDHWATNCGVSFNPDYPKAYNKTDFRVTFADGKVYTGCLDFRHIKAKDYGANMDNNLVEHIGDHVRFYGGLCTVEELPKHFKNDVESYHEYLMSGYGETHVADYAKFLDTYQIG